MDGYRKEMVIVIEGVEKKVDGRVPSSHRCVGVIIYIMYLQMCRKPRIEWESMWLMPKPMRLRNLVGVFKSVSRNIQFPRQTTRRVDSDQIDQFRLMTGFS
jgi:hypothetical protein